MGESEQDLILSVPSLRRKKNNNYFLSGLLSLRMYHYGAQSKLLQNLYCKKKADFTSGRTKFKSQAPAS